MDEAQTPEIAKGTRVRVTKRWRASLPAGVTGTALQELRPNPYYEGALWAYVQWDDGHPICGYPADCLEVIL